VGAGLTHAAGSFDECVTIRLGLQIPTSSYGASVAELFPALKEQAHEAEAAGFDTVLVMDHFYQLPTLGEPDGVTANTIRYFGHCRREGICLQIYGETTYFTTTDPIARITCGAPHIVGTAVAFPLHRYNQDLAARELATFTRSSRASPERLESTSAVWRATTAAVPDEELSVKKAIELLAAIGGFSAIVALSFLENATALAGSGHGAIPLPPNTVAPMTIGATMTRTSAATTLATPVASPTHKAIQPTTVAPGGGDWICVNSVPQPTC
jgi:hypothetical protein